MIIGLSGHVQSYFIESGLAAGMDIFESKPLYARRMLQILQQTNLIAEHEKNIEEVGIESR